MQLLLEHGAQLDVNDAEGISPLIEAVLKRHDKVVRVLYTKTWCRNYHPKRYWGVDKA